MKIGCSSFLARTFPWKTAVAKPEIIISTLDQGREPFFLYEKRGTVKSFLINASHSSLSSSVFLEEKHADTLRKILYTIMKNPNLNEILIRYLRLGKFDEKLFKNYF